MSDKKTAKASRIKEFTCRECIHFNSVPLLGHDQVCSKEGVKGGRIAPTCFTPDVTQLTQSSDHFAQLVGLTQSLTRAQKRVLLALLNTKPKKMEFGTKVYFKAIGGDYLSNYLSGFVVTTTARGGIVVMGDPDSRKRGRPYLAIFRSADDLLSESEFKLKRKKLVAKGLLNDPKKPVRRGAVKEDYVPPTIDSTFDKKVKIGSRAAVDKVITSSGRPSTFVVSSKGDRK